MMKRVWCILLILVLFTGCMTNDLGKPQPYSNSGAAAIPVLSATWTAKKDSIPDRAKLFIDLFSQEYEGSYITKVRWQLVEGEDDNSTYIIEGIGNGNKYILKLLDWGSGTQTMEDIAILGRVERPLTETELDHGQPLEPPLELSAYIGVDQLTDTALKEYDSIVQEWKVVWVDHKEIIQVLLWNESHMQKILILDARSGDVLRKMP